MIGDNQKNQFLQDSMTGRAEAAKRMRQAAIAADASRYDLLFQTRGQAIPVTLVYGISVIFAMFLVDAEPPTASEGTSIMKALFGPGIQAFTGEADMDRLIAILSRGAGIFLLTGLIPLMALVLTFLFSKRRLHPMTACWLALVLVPLFLYPFVATLRPLLNF